MQINPTNSISSVFDKLLCYRVGLTHPPFHRGYGWLKVLQATKAIPFIKNAFVRRDRCVCVCVHCCLPSCVHTTEYSAGSWLHSGTLPNLLDTKEKRGVSCYIIKHTHTNTHTRMFCLRWHVHGLFLCACLCLRLINLPTRLRALRFKYRLPSSVSYIFENIPFKPAPSPISLAGLGGRGQTVNSPHTLTWTRLLPLAHARRSLTVPTLRLMTSLAWFMSPNKSTWNNHEQGPRSQSCLKLKRWL